MQSSWAVNWLLDSVLEEAELAGLAGSAAALAPELAGLAVPAAAAVAPAPQPVSVVTLPLAAALSQLLFFFALPALLFPAPVQARSFLLLLLPLAFVCPHQRAF